MPHYGLSLMRETYEERADLVTEEPLEEGDTFERLGELWRVAGVEQSEIGRFDAWLVCSQVDALPADT